MRLLRNTKKIAISALILCVFLFTVGGFLCTSTKINWNTTECQSYQFKVKSETKTIGSKIKSSDTYITEITGILNYKFFEETDDLIRIGFQLSPAKYIVNGTENRILSEFYSLPFFVEFSKSGDIIKIYSESVSKDDSELIEMLISPLKIVSKKAFWGKWSTIESDPNGLYSSSYSKTFSETKKKRHKYVSYTNNENKQTQIKFISSENIFKQNTKCSWIHSFNSKEKIFFSNMESNIKNSITYNIYFISANLSETSTLNNFKDFESAFSTILNNKQNNYSIKDRIRIDETKEQLQKESIRSLASKFESHKISQTDFERQLADFLILNPDEALKIYDAILSSSFPQKTINSLLASLSLASTNQCQKVLVNVSSNPGIKYNNRLQAAIFLGELQKINIDTVKNIEANTYNFQDQNNSIISSAMLCSIGRLYGQQSKDYPSEEFDEMNRFLNSKLESVKSTSDTCALIRAIGNTADASFYTKINDFRTNSSSASIRAAALETLTKIDNEQASDLLLDSFRNDKDPTVITAAIRIQSSRNENPEFTKDVASRIVSENDIEIKNVMIDYFMTNGKNDPKVKDLLLETLKNETDPFLRVKLHKAIYSKINKTK